MAYTPVAGSDARGLAARAEPRWCALLGARPELAPAVALQRRLLAIMAETARSLDWGVMPGVSLPAEHLAEKLSRGVPALAGERIPLPVPVLTPALLQSCAALAEGGAGDAATHIRDAIERGEINP